jgi:hypothetical protein
MIDFDKFKYRVGDRIRKIQLSSDQTESTEYEIIAIDEGENNQSRRLYGYKHYKLKNLAPGCVDSPSWQSQNIVHMYFEPCNPAAKLLYSKNVVEFRTEYAADYVTKTVISGRRAGKSWLYQQFQDYEANRAELAKPDSHSLDALRYSVLGQPSKKVSR